MNDHQRRLWLAMIDQTNEFRKGSRGFDSFVGQLEGALDAGDFADDLVVRSWYELWTPLENLRATRGSAVRYEDVAEEVQALHDFLVETLSSDFGDRKV